MSRNSTRLHDQIVDLLTKAHTEQDEMDSRITSLQQAMEYLLYHNSSNERIDEFLETFLSMHVDRSAPIRRFCAYFIEMLVFTRSRFACSCLDVLVTLLQDSDRQVVLFALRAARVVYKRALYWISVQQREAVYVQAARESVEVLDNLLARIVHLITSSSREVFCESIRCAQTVVLCQSFSSFAPRSIAHLESVGCGSLEELKLVDTFALDESKLNAQADRLFTALCALLMKKEDENFQMETVALIHAVGRIGHERASYIGAATVAFSQLANDSRATSRVQGALVCELRRILSSRHCVEWQPQIVPILNRLGIQTAEIVLAAEMDRMKDQITDEFGLKRRGKSLDGERLMKISEMADCFKVPDEDHAAAVCSVRATSPAELASLALAMLSKLGRKFSEPTLAIQRVVSDGKEPRPSVGFEQKLLAIKTMAVGISDFSHEDSSIEEEQNDVVMGNIDSPVIETAIDASTIEDDIAAPLASIGTRNKALFTKLVLGPIGGTRDEKIAHIAKFFEHELKSEEIAGIVDIFFAVNSTTDVTVDDLGFVFVACVKPVLDAAMLGRVRQIIFELPAIPASILDFISSLVGNDESVRRWALTCISSLAVSKPGISVDCIEHLLVHASSKTEAVRTDSLKLLVTKIYKPKLDQVLLSQWPYDAKKCRHPLVESGRQGSSKLGWIMSEVVEQMAMKRVEGYMAGNGVWENVWPYLALCSKKPILLHYFFSLLVEHTNVQLPADLLAGFTSTLALLPGELIDNELELLVHEYKSVRAAGKKNQRNDFLLPILSAISNTQRGLTGTLADAALAFSNTMESITSNFSELGIELDNDWLAGVEVVHDQASLSLDDVYLALMGSDLRRSCTCNTFNSSSHRMNASKSFLFQISSSVDISIPDSQRPRTSPSAKRVLKLELSCGRTTVHAIELEPCPELPDDPDAGMKIIVTGSPIVSKGLILLKPSNLRIIGGQVDELVLLQKQRNARRISERDPLGCPVGNS